MTNSGAGNIFDPGLGGDLALLDLTRRAIADWERQSVKGQTPGPWQASRGRRLLQDLRERRLSLADSWKRRKMTAAEIKKADRAVFEVDDLIRSLAPKIAAITPATVQKGAPAPGTGKGKSAAKPPDALGDPREGSAEWIRGQIESINEDPKIRELVETWVIGWQRELDTLREAGDENNPRLAELQDLLDLYEQATEKGKGSMRAHNMYDDQGTFKGKPIRDVMAGGGAAGRALLGDFKRPVAEARTARQTASKVAKAAEARRLVADLQKAHGVTRDPVQRKEIEGIIARLTEKFELSDSTKSQEADAAKILAEWRLQAEQLVFALESLIEQTAELPLRESLGQFAGRIRQQYSILSVQPPHLEPEGLAQVKDRREQAGRVIADLEGWRDKTDDQALERELDRMAKDLRRTYGIVGPPLAGQGPNAGQRGSVVALLPGARLKTGR
jgi:hypothetical protein